jgi:hypothetical protein
MVLSRSSGFVDVTFYVAGQGDRPNQYGFRFTSADGTHSFTIVRPDRDGVLQSETGGQSGVVNTVVIPVKQRINYRVQQFSTRRSQVEAGTLIDGTEGNNRPSDSIFADGLGTANDNNDIQLRASIGAFVGTRVENIRGRTNFDITYRVDEGVPSPVPVPSPTTWRVNPIGVSAIIIACCPKRVGGKGVVIEVIPEEPGNKYLPTPTPTPPTPTPPTPTPPTPTPPTPTPPTPTPPTPTPPTPTPPTPTPPTPTPPTPTPPTPTPGVPGVPTYPVALELDDVIIENPGINYSPEDPITITPDNGAELEFETDNFGRITNVNVLNPGFGFTTYPTIRISTASGGVNAKFIPKFRIIRDPIVVDESKLIQVTDLVGIKQTGYIDGRPYFGAVFYENNIKYAGYYETVGDLVQVYDTLKESIDAQVTTPPSAIQRQGTDVTSNDPRLNIPGTPQNLI